MHMVNFCHNTKGPFYRYKVISKSIQICSFGKLYVDEYLLYLLHLKMNW